MFSAPKTSRAKVGKKNARRCSQIQSESITEYRDQNGELVVTARSVGVVTEKVIEQ